MRGWLEITLAYRAIEQYYDIFFSDNFNNFNLQKCNYIQYSKYYLIYFVLNYNILSIKLVRQITIFSLVNTLLCIIF